MTGGATMSFGRRGRRREHARRAQSAFTLVETMVALLVISIGLIGLAALEAQGLAAARDALLRTRAVHLAADMAERIRGNRAARAAYAGAAADRGCDGAGARSCTPRERAQHDLFVWTARVAELLPAGAGSVRVAGGDPPFYTVDVAWRETGVAAGAAPRYSLTIAVPAP